MPRRTRVTARERHLLTLQTHEGKLIASIKKAAALGHRARYNQLRMELVKVRERIRRAGGEPAERPLAGVPVPEREGVPGRVQRPQRPERQPVRAARPPVRPGTSAKRPMDEDDNTDIPEEDEPPAEDEGTEGWDDADPMDLLVRGIRHDGGTVVQRRGNVVVARAAGPINDGGRAIRQAIEKHLHVGAAVRQLSPNTVRITLREDEEEDFGADEPRKKGNLFEAFRKKAAPAANGAHKPNVLDKLKDLVRKKGPHTTTRLGQHMAINVRAGFRAAVMEVKPGLFVVAEVPTGAVRQDFGDEIGILPLILAPMIAKAVKKGIDNKKAGAEPAQLEAAPAPKQLTGPVATEGRPFGLDPEDVPRWLDADLAGEFGCQQCGNTCGRR